VLNTPKFLKLTLNELASVVGYQSNQSSVLIKRVVIVEVATISGHLEQTKYKILAIRPAKSISTLDQGISAAGQASDASLEACL